MPIFRKIYLECSGSDSPTVILESGYRNDTDIWSAELEPGMSPVFPQVAKFTRVCAYDRPGTFLDPDQLGRSTPVPMPRTARDLVSDLHALLQTARVPGPYVFAGHWFGGIFAGLYASTSNPTMGTTEDRHIIRITGIKCITVTTVIITIAIGATRGTRGPGRTIRTVLVAAMCVSNPDRSPVKIQRLGKSPSFMTTMR
jgi:hypothetical protein